MTTKIVTIAIENGSIMGSRIGESAPKITWDSSTEILTIRGYDLIPVSENTLWRHARRAVLGNYYTAKRKINGWIK